MSRPHGTGPRDLAAAGSPADGGGEPPAAGSRPAAPERPAVTAMWQLSIVTLARLALLCGAGVLLRLAIEPGQGVATTAWIAATALSAVPMYRLTSPHARARRPRPPGTWQPGEEPPEGVPAATIQAATRAFAQLPSPWAAWLKIAPCTDPAGHDGMCLGAGAEPAGGGMMSVVLGERIAGRPADAGFVLAHETRHPSAGNATCHWPPPPRGRPAGWPPGGQCPGRGCPLPSPPSRAPAPWHAGSRRPAATSPEPGSPAATPPSASSPAARPLPGSPGPAGHCGGGPSPSSTLRPCQPRTRHGGCAASSSARSAQAGDRHERPARDAGRPARAAAKRFRPLSCGCCWP
jgi:hypothetical protein